MSNIGTSASGTFCTAKADNIENMLQNQSNLNKAITKTISKNKDEATIAKCKFGNTKRFVCPIKKAEPLP